MSKKTLQIRSNAKPCPEGQVEVKKLSALGLQAETKETEIHPKTRRQAKTCGAQGKPGVQCGWPEH
jgi:hypothetical protein